MSTTSPGASPPTLSRRAPSYALLVVTVVVVAANLRPTITALGPIIERVGSDTGLSPAALGFLGAIPLLTFGAVSPIVHHVASRWGVDRAVLAALVVLTFGTVVRSLPGFDAWLWVGTVLLSAAIAVANVLMPAVVKRDFPNRVSVMTGVYAASMSAFAALASGIAVPLASAVDWELALGVWAIPAAIAAGIWGLRLRGRTRPAAPAVVVPGPGSSMWTSAVAWQVAIVMALQSSMFYLLVTWLPSIEAAHGVAESVAGWHLFFFQFIGILAGLAAGPLLHRGDDQRSVGLASAALMVVAMLGLMLAPALVVAWTLLAGLSSGASLVVALTLISERTRTPQAAGRLSGMAQSVGYLLSALGPIAAGFLFQLTGSWTPVLVLMTLLALGLGVTVSFAGRNGFTHPE